MKFERLGPYRVGKRLGSGGMGEVYEGLHAETGERAAIKVLNPLLAHTEGFRERFEAEIDSLRRLRHPNIVALFGFGEHDGYLFYAMELVDGRSLEDELSCQRRFHWREVTDIAIQLSKALKHAHDHGVIHRDLKPANVLLTHENQAKLLDFGIARLFGSSQITSVGGVLGTADYMSPEQADGRGVTEKCDQYSLGGVLYALCTGRPPFHSTSLPKLLQMQRFSRPEPVRKYNPAIPLDLERIVLQLLEKEPQRRFPNMLVLARHMAAMERGLSLTRDSADFELSDPAAIPDWERDEDSAGETQVASPREVAALAEQARVKRAPSDSTLGDEVLEIAPDEPPPSRFPAQRPPEAENRFTTVAAGDAGEPAAVEHEPPKLLHVAGLLGALLLVLAVTAWFLWPPSADDLYQKIVAATDEGDPVAQAATSSQIESFLARFPDDPRSGQIAARRETLALDQAERRLRARSRVRGGESLAPIERMYVDALRLMETDWTQGAEALRAILALYERQQLEPDSAEDRCLKLARRALGRLDAQEDQAGQAARDEFVQRLAEADRLRTVDPAKARPIYEALITLGRDQPWAGDLVRAAQQRLEDLPGPAGKDDEPMHDEPVPEE